MLPNTNIDPEALKAGVKKVTSTQISYVIAQKLPNGTLTRKTTITSIVRTTNAQEANLVRI